MLVLAFFFAAAWFVTGAMAAHLPRLFEAAGASPAAAVAASWLRRPGPGPGANRRVRLDAANTTPLISARIAAALHPIGAALLGALGPLEVIGFALLHGAGNGIITIAKGTLPLAIFGPHGFGLRSGVLWPAPARITQSPPTFATSVRAHARGSCCWAAALKRCRRCSASGRCAV